VPIPGITLVYSEPVRMVDITRTPYCMVGLGGLQLGANEVRKQGGYNRAYKR
jgi:conjugal transfer pilus assembly protein TraU